MTSSTPTPTEDNAADPRDAELAELRAGWQRTQADFENFRRRVEHDREALGQRIAADVLLEFLPAYDNFQRAFAHVSDEHASWTDGFRHIAKQMEAVFAAHGLERIPTIGTPFDPEVHEAVSQLPHPKHPADTVAEELESGWRCNGQVIKPAKVVISTGQPEQKKGPAQ